VLSAGKDRVDERAAETRHSCARARLIGTRSATRHQSAGWELEWLGDETTLKGGDVVRAGYLPVNEAMKKKVRSVTGITEPILNFGHGSEESLRIAFHSHLATGANENATLGS
jgi:hypothetical protein